MTPALRFRVIYERNFALSTEMSFFISCPIRNAVPGPDPIPVSGRGTLRPPVKGNEIKKDISVLSPVFRFLGDLSLFYNRGVTF
jgi:hypothetical protein